MPARKPISKAEQRARKTELLRKASDGELVFPEAVKEMRETLGFTQEKYARTHGLTRKQVVELESGECNPTLETLKKLAHPWRFKVGFVDLKKIPNWAREKDDPRYVPEEDEYATKKD